VDAHNELELRKILKKGLSPEALSEKILQRLADPTGTWEEKRPLWHFLYSTGRHESLSHALIQALQRKERVPFDLIMALLSQVSAATVPSMILEAVIKGIRKQSASQDLMVFKQWDRLDSRLGDMRTQTRQELKHSEEGNKEALIEKYEFLFNQRMFDQARRVLRQLKELLPSDPRIKKYQTELDELFAREVIADHLSAQRSDEALRSKIFPSNNDEQMLISFLREGERFVVNHPVFAKDLCLAFLFMEDYTRALMALDWMEQDLSCQWLRAELLFASGRWIEALEYLKQMEAFLNGDPEVTFATAYLRAQCLYALNQQAAAVEILESIASIRPNYRSVSALLLEWKEGVR